MAYTIKFERGSKRVIIPYPVPPTLKCGLCSMARGGGPWSTSECQALARKHLKKKHSGSNVGFRCVKCKDAFDSLHGGRNHNPCRKSASNNDSSRSSGTPAGSNLTIIDTSTNTNRDTSIDCFTSCSIQDGKLILPYPGRPTRCPISQCDTEFVTFDERSGAMTSMHRHLATSHALLLEKIWRCTICGHEDGGQQMNCDFPKCSRSMSSSPPPPNLPHPTPLP